MESNTSQFNNISHTATFLNTAFKSSKNQLLIGSATKTESESTKKRYTLDREAVDFYKRYLSTVKQRKCDPKPIPVPINELSRTLSIETLSFTHWEHDNNEEGLEAFNKNSIKPLIDCKDRSGSTNVNTSTSYKLADLEENPNVKAIPTSKLGKVFQVYWQVHLVHLNKKSFTVQTKNHLDIKGNNLILLLRVTLRIFLKIQEFGCVSRDLN